MLSSRNVERSGGTVVPANGLGFRAALVFRDPSQVVNVLTSTAKDQSQAGFSLKNRQLAGLVFAVTTYFLFAQTMLNVLPRMREDLGIDLATGNIAVSLTALFAGIFVVVAGGLADKIGRVKVSITGLVLSIIGSALIALTPARAGVATEIVLMSGRACQGLAAACIMPATLALVKAYRSGAARQSALSFWSIGSWGGSGITALFGGLMASYVGWRWIFVVSILVAALSLLLIRDIPESRVARSGADTHFDWAGVVPFVIALVALNVVISQGAHLGWASVTVLALVVVLAVAAYLFVKAERRASSPFMDFTLFRDRIYTGATGSNLLLNGAVGTLLVTLGVVQSGAGMTSFQAGLLTLGYLVAVLCTIRVGEKLLQRRGPRFPMLLGSLVTAVGIFLLTWTFLLIGQYIVVAVVGFTLFGIGLGLYATPSLDAALSNIPAAEAGSAAGIYKMASLLGGAFGTAISGAIYNALGTLSPESVFLGDLLVQGRTDNEVIRFAAAMALLFNVLIVLCAAVVIRWTIPKRYASAPS